MKKLMSLFGWSNKSDHPPHREELLFPLLPPTDGLIKKMRKRPVRIIASISATPPIFIALSIYPANSQDWLVKIGIYLTDQVASTLWRNCGVADGLSLSIQAKAPAT